MVVTERRKPFVRESVTVTGQHSAEIARQTGRQISEIDLRHAEPLSSDDNSGITKGGKKKTIQFALRLGRNLETSGEWIVKVTDNGLERTRETAEAIERTLSSGLFPHVKVLRHRTDAKRTEGVKAYRALRKSGVVFIEKGKSASPKVKKEMYAKWSRQKTEAQTDDGIISPQQAGQKYYRQYEKRIDMLDAFLRPKGPNILIIRVGSEPDIIAAAVGVLHTFQLAGEIPTIIGRAPSINHLEMISWTWLRDKNILEFNYKGETYSRERTHKFQKNIDINS